MAGGVSAQTLMGMAKPHRIALPDRMQHHFFICHHQGAVPDNFDVAAGMLRDEESSPVQSSLEHGHNVSQTSFSDDAVGWIRDTPSCVSTTKRLRDATTL